jgi:hypothetical protein
MSLARDTILIKTSFHSHDRMVELLAVYARSPQARISRHRSRPGAARRIEATDRQIDRLVYELYGLTEEEIQIVAESVK